MDYTINLDTGGGGYTQNAISRILDEAPGLYSSYLNNKRLEAGNIRAQETHDMQMEMYQKQLENNEKLKESERILVKYSEGQFNSEALWAPEPDKTDTAAYNDYLLKQEEFYKTAPTDPYTAYKDYANEMRTAGLNPNPQAFYSLYIPQLKNFQAQKTGKFNQVYRQLLDSGMGANEIASILKDRFGGDEMLNQNSLLYAGDPNAPALSYMGYNEPEPFSLQSLNPMNLIYDEPVEFGGQQYGGGYKFPGGSTGGAIVGGGAAGYGALQGYGQYTDIRDAFKTKVKNDMGLHHSTFKKKYGFTQKSVSNLSDDEIWKKAKKSTKTSFLADTKYGKTIKGNLKLLKSGALPYAGLELVDQFGVDPLISKLPGGEEGKTQRVAKEVTDVAKVPATAAVVGVMNKARQKINEKGMRVFMEVVKKKGAPWVAQRVGKAGFAGLMTFFSKGLGSTVAYGMIAKDIYDIATIIAESE